jgi:hypothetical protein
MAQTPYYVDLEHGGADRHCYADRPKVGDLIRSHGLVWRVTRVDHDAQQAFARPVDEA